jgi:hypothetical protein
MTALLYLDESMAQSESLDSLGRVLAKGIQFNLHYVIKPYPEMNMLDHDAAHGRSLLEEAKHRLAKPVCQVNRTECMVGVPIEKSAKRWMPERFNKSSFFAVMSIYPP